MREVSDLKVHNVIPRNKLLVLMLLWCLTLLSL